jgi:hypothetical protein
MKNGFVPIKIDKYIELHLKNNPDENKQELKKRLNQALKDNQKALNAHVVMIFG